MSKNNSKSLASLRQKLRKYNKDFEEELKVFRENPDVGDEDEDQHKGKIKHMVQLIIKLLRLVKR